MSFWERRILVATFEELFLQLCLGDLDFHSFVDLFCMPAFVIGVIFDGRREERIDEGCLSKS